MKQYNEILEQAKKYDKVQSFTPALLYKNDGIVEKTLIDTIDQDVEKL